MAKKKDRNSMDLREAEDIKKRCQEYTVEKGQSLQQMVWGKMDIRMQDNGFGPLIYTTKKINFKWIS